MQHSLYLCNCKDKDHIKIGTPYSASAVLCILQAVIISSVTLGIGHLINLFNGSGMDLVNNLCQISFAIAVGFLLVTVFYYSGSLLPCIITHSAINTLNIFSNTAGVTVEKQIIYVLIMIVLTVGYTLFLTRTLRKKSVCK